MLYKGLTKGVTVWADTCEILTVYHYYYYNYTVYYYYNCFTGLCPGLPR